ncbi:MAG: septum formation inhibitor Maf [Gammaproteobacteria bacterium]|nr:septum formation inhibitor Maf [Gammaproteobacteria bacterium]
MINPKLYLASRSPRRRLLLEQIGVEITPLAVEVVETPGEHEKPADYVQRLAMRKATAGWCSEYRKLPLPVLGADTCIAFGGEILGKPTDTDHALALLSRLSGNRHLVYSAVVIADGQKQLVRMSSTMVWFREISAGELAAYCATGEPIDKAGAYAIQGKGAAFISRIDGSYSGVMGLPLFETTELLAEFGIHVLN